MKKNYDFGSNLLKKLNRYKLSYITPMLYKLSRLSVHGIYTRKAPEKAFVSERNSLISIILTKLNYLLLLLLLLISSSSSSSSSSNLTYIT